MKQLIISLGRQVGSGGHKIAEALAERFSLPLYDKNLIAELAAPAGSWTRRRCESMKRRPGIPTFPGVSGGLSNSAEAGLAGMQFLFLAGKGGQRGLLCRLRSVLGVHSAGVSRADLSVRPGGPGRPGGQHPAGPSPDPGRGAGVYPQGR